MYIAPCKFLRHYNKLTIKFPRKIEHVQTHNIHWEYMALKCNKWTIFPKRNHFDFQEKGHWVTLISRNAPWFWISTCYLIESLTVRQWQNHLYYRVVCATAKCRKGRRYIFCDTFLFHTFIFSPAAIGNKYPLSKVKYDISLDIFPTCTFVDTGKNTVIYNSHQNMLCDWVT